MTDILLFVIQDRGSWLDPVGAACCDILQYPSTAGPRSLPLALGQPRLQRSSIQKNLHLVENFRTFYSNMATISPARPSLTNNDAAVLQALFDAESSPSSGITIDTSLPPWPSSVTVPEDDLGVLQRRETEIISKLQASEKPTRETVQSALDDLNTLVDQHPSYPPVYTNRAQVLRLLVNLQHNQEPVTVDPQSGASAEDALFTPQASELSSRIFADLGQAIDLATPASPADPVSSMQARLLADTHTHRGYLLLKAARTRKTQVFRQDSGEGGPECLRGLGADKLEEMASHDFFMGGRFGNKVAQQLAVQTNPYAKMCGAIVQEAMRKELKE